MMTIFVGISIYISSFTNTNVAIIVPPYAQPLLILLYVCLNSIK